MDTSSSPLEDKPNPPGFHARCLESGLEFIATLASVAFSQGENAAKMHRLLSALNNPKDKDAVEHLAAFWNGVEAFPTQDRAMLTEAECASLQAAFRDLGNRLAASNHLEGLLRTVSGMNATGGISTPPGPDLPQRANEFLHFEQLKQVETAFLLLSRLCTIAQRLEPALNEIATVHLATLAQAPHTAGKKHPALEAGKPLDHQLLKLLSSSLDTLDAPNDLTGRSSMQDRLRRVQMCMKILDQEAVASTAFWKFLKSSSKVNAETWEILTSVVEQLKCKSTKKTLLPFLQFLRHEDPTQILKAIQKFLEVSKDVSPDVACHIVPDIFGRNFHLLTDIREDACFRDLAEPVVSMGKSFLYYDRLYNLYQGLSNVRRAYPKSVLNVAEIGVYRGGTSYFLCTLLQKLHNGKAKFYSVDTFEGHSSLDFSDRSEGTHEPGVFSRTSFDDVVSLLAEFPFVSVIKSRIQDCSEMLKDEMFHFVHLDVDLFQPMYYSLKFFAPRLAVAGMICVDDYNKKSCPGVHQAVEQLLRDNLVPLTAIYTQTAQCLLIRTATATLS